MDNKRIEWIDGLKGISCILIFIHHFTLAFYPASFYGDASASHISFDILASVSPLSVIINGNFIVHIFCILSAIVLSLQMKNRKANDISNSLFKRYFHFVLLILPIGILTYLAIRFGLISNLAVSEITKSKWLAMHYQQGLPLSTMIKSALYGVLFKGDYSISTAYWMMNYIFLGTYLVFILNTVFYQRKKISYLFLSIPAIGLISNNNYLVDFIIGFLFVKLLSNLNIIKNKYINYLISIMFIAIGLFLGGYPSGVIPTNIYRYLNYQSMFFHHMIGASLLIIGFSMNPIAKKLLSNRLLLKLSKISFSVYLLHILIMFSFSMTLFSKLYVSIKSYNISVLITFICTCVVLIFTSWIYYTVVEKRVKKIEVGLIKATSKLSKFTKE